MANVSISATFPTSGQAASAAAKLRALRADRVHIDKQPALEASAAGGRISLLVESSQELAAGEAIRLTADVHEGVQPQVLRVLEQCGGQRCQ